MLWCVRQCPLVEKKMWTNENIEHQEVAKLCMSVRARHESVVLRFELEVGS